MTLCSWIGLFSQAFAEEPKSQGGIPPFIEIGFQSEGSITCPGMKRFLVMEPRIAIPSRDGDTIKLKGGLVGTTSLLVWIDKLYTIKVKISPPVISVSQQEKALEKEKFQQQMVMMEMSYNYAQDAMGSDLKHMNDKSSIQNADFLIKAPFYKDTRFEMRGNLNKGDSAGPEYNLFSVMISDITWPKSQKYSVRVGDAPALSGANPYTYATGLKGITVEPLRFNVWNASHPLDVSLFYGYLENRTGQFWGGYGETYLFNNNTSNYLTSPKKEYMTRVSLFYHPLTTIFGFAHSWKLDWAHVLPKNGYKSKEIYNLDMKFRNAKRKGNFDFSVGGDLNHVSYSAGYSRRFGDLGLRLQKIYVTPGVDNLNGTLAGSDTNSMAVYYTTEKSWNFFHGLYMGWDVSQGIRKTEDYTGDTVNETLVEHNLNFRTRTWENNFGLQLTYDDESDSLNPNKRMYYNIDYSGRHHLLVKGGWAVRYQYGETQRLTNDTLDSNNSSITGMLNFNLLKWLNYAISQSVSDINYVNLGEKSTSTSTGHAVSCPFSFFSGRLNALLGYGYVTTHYDKRVAFNSSVMSSQTGNIGLSYAIVEDTTLHVNYYSRLEDRDVGAYQGDRARSQFMAGVISKFGTLFGWRPKTEIKVIAFEDANGNGIYEADIDRPLRDVGILLNDKPAGKTDEWGELDLGKIKGFNKTVSVDPNTVPHGYMYTTLCTYEFFKPKSTKEKCLFGFNVNTEISGTIFNDVNNNQIFDDQDIPFKDVTVSLSNGTTATTDLNGHYCFPMIREGDYELKVDVFTIPGAYTSVTNVKKRIKVMKGASVREDYCFKAMRMLKGMVKIKHNGVYTPLPGVEINLMENRKKTSEEGSFKFLDVPGGSIYLKISLEGLPYKIKNAYPAPLNFEPGVSKELTIPLLFSKGPENKNVEITLEE